MQFLLFLSWLFLHLAASAVRMAYQFALIHSSEVCAVMLLCWAIWMVITHTIVQTRNSPRPTPTQAQPRVSQETINQEILFWEKISHQQPTDRDVLLNLSALYKANNNETSSEEALKRAKLSDPNYSFEN